ncbi:MAG: acetylornithine deacetylase [Alphaproteobacteria bacterium]|nr:acetylornithine deacetylase [Alphaproteobacteria bacterium]
MTVREILARLVAFDTTSSRSNADLMDWVADYLDGWSMRVRLLPGLDSGKTNLIASIGPETADGIVLSSHSDTVPATAAGWDSDPYCLSMRDGRYYGRGTADMKGFLSVVLAAVPDLAKANLTKPVHIVVSHDEEVGCLGAPALIENLPEAGIVIVGEPTGMRVADRHRGACIQTMRIRGIPAHSGMPELGVNAVTHMAAFVRDLDGIATQLAMVDAPPDKQTNIVLTGISGGTAQNIVPESCDATWMIRCAANEDPAEIRLRLASKAEAAERRMKLENSCCEIDLDLLCDVPPLMPATDNVARDLCQDILNDDTTIGLEFATEAGLFQAAGLPVAVCGPGHMAQGHTVNEFIECGQLRKAEFFMEGMIEHVSQ